MPWLSRCGRCAGPDDDAAQDTAPPGGCRASTAPRDRGLAWKAIRQRDLPMVMGTVLFAAVFIVAANLAVDLFYRALDPRMRGET